MNSFQNNIRIGICESGSQVDWLWQQKPELSASVTHWIAANPDSAWAFEKQKVNYISIENFQYNKTNDEIEYLLASQKRWARSVDSFLCEKNRQFNLNKFRPTLYYLQYFKIVFDTILQRIELLNKISEAIQPEEILYFKNDPPLNFERDLTFNFSILGVCIGPWADYHCIRQIPLSSLPEDNLSALQFYNTNFFSKIRASCRKILPENPIYYLQLQFIISLLKKYARKLSGNHVKIIVNPYYDITNDLIYRLQSQGADIILFNSVFDKKPSEIPDNEMKFFLQEVWEDITCEDWFWDPYGRKLTLPLKDILSRVFEYFWFDIIPQLWMSIRYATKWIRLNQPNLILTDIVWSSNDLGIWRIGFIMAARNEQIPTVFYQHGASMGDIENVIWDLTDCLYGDYQFVYGNGEKEYLIKRKGDITDNKGPIPVGSVRLDEIQWKNKNIDKKRKKIRDKIIGTSQKPVVLYVPTVFINNYYRFDYYDIRFERLFQVRKQLADLFCTYSDIHFLYKSFVSYGNDPTNDMLAIRCPSWQRRGDIPLTELQYAADLIIHEMPSTGMYESLLTNIAMIVYVDKDIYRMSEDVKKLLNKRTIVAETNESFIHTIDEQIKNKSFSRIEHPNCDFLRRFCTYTNDGMSASRVVDAIYRNIKKHN